MSAWQAHPVYIAELDGDAGGLVWGRAVDGEWRGSASGEELMDSLWRCSNPEGEPVNVDHTDHCVRAESFAVTNSSRTARIVGQLLVTPVFISMGAAISGSRFMRLHRAAWGSDVIMFVAINERCGNIEEHEKPMPLTKSTNLRRTPSDGEIFVAVDDSINGRYYGHVLCSSTSILTSLDFDGPVRMDDLALVGFFAISL